MEQKKYFNIMDLKVDYESLTVDMPVQKRL